MVVKIWTSRKHKHKNPIFWICTRFWPLVPPPGMDPWIGCCGMKLTLHGIYGTSKDDFRQVVVKILTSRKLNTKILSIGHYLASRPGMDPGVQCRGMKANTTRYLMVKVCMLSDKWVSKYGLLENFYRKNPIFWICTSFWPLAPPPARTLDPNVVEWKLIPQGIYGASMNAFWQDLVFECH